MTSVPVAVGSPTGRTEFFHVRQGIPSSSSLSRSFMQSIVSRDELDRRGRRGGRLRPSPSTYRRHLILRIDTEATEAAVIHGMQVTLRREHPSIVCEMLDQEVASAVEALLAPLDYEFFLLTANGPLHCEHTVPIPRRNYIFVPLSPSATSEAQSGLT